MKKNLLIVSITALSILSFMSCNQATKWNKQERQAMRNLLRDYRDMVYINDLTDAEYMLFSDNVTTNIEDDYPVYTTFIKMPGANDTVKVYIVTTIVEELNTNANNMRHIYPYQYLVGENILPSGLDHSQQSAFYNCLAAKVNNTYTNTASFFDAILNDTTASSQIYRMQQLCANDLFDQPIDILEITETVSN